MKKDLLVVFLLSLVTVALFISGIFMLAEMESITTKLFASGTLFALAIGSGISLGDAIVNADRAMITFDDEDAYEYFTKELAEAEAKRDSTS
jgi:uncharacterized membrane protein